MSVLHRRIMSQGSVAPGYLPYGTGATPMLMPLAVVHYQEETALYGPLHPLVTADGAVIPGRAQFRWPESVPGGEAVGSGST